MVTKILDGTYSAGYALAAGYTAVSITGSGVVDGVTSTAYGAVGGVGLTLAFPATAINAGLIDGGGGAPGYRTSGKSKGGNGGDGGVGVDLTTGGSVENDAKIVGGKGGLGGQAYAGGDGGTGGAAIYLANGGAVVNTATLQGGDGGTGGPGSFYGYGGAGGAGVVLASGGTVINSGYIVGGFGGRSPGNLSYGLDGDGVRLLAGGAVSNTGRIGLQALTDVYAGRYGVDLVAGGTLTNGGSASSTATIEGRIGVFVGGGPATVTNFGEIHGYAGFAVVFNAASDRLIAEAGSAFFGTVSGGGGTLELAGGVGTVTGLGGAGTLTGAVSANFSGFGSYVIDAGSVWTLTNGDTVSSGKSLTSHGSLVAGGALTNAGTVSLASAGSATDLRILAAGATLSGGGTVAMSGATARILGVSAATVLTNVDDTIAGTGFIGASQLTLINQAGGVIDASTKGQLVVGTAGAVLTNAGLMEANGGLLVITHTTVSNVGGTIEAASGSVVNLSDDVVQGGMLGMAGGGAINVNVAGGELDGSTHAVTVGGLIQVLSGKTLILDGAIANTGRLNTFAYSSTADLIVGADGVTLSGKGSVNLSNSVGNRIYGLAASDVLTNVDNHIDGAGLLGKGVLTLVNDAAGQIIGNQNLALTIDTGANTITNAGLIENVGKGGTLVKSAVNNTGILQEATAGTLTLAGQVTGTGVAKVSGGTLYVVQAFAENVTFNGTTGVLKLGDSQAYSGKIIGLSKTGTNWLDLADIGYFSATTKASFSGTTASGTLTVTDGTHTAKITLSGNYAGSSFTVSSDGHGGTKVVDPAPATAPFIAAMAAFAAPPAPDLAHAQNWRPAMTTLAHPRA